MQQESGVTNLQTELNYLDLFKSYCNSSDFGFLGSEGWGRWVGVSGVVSYSLYEFRNVQRYRIFKQNRIISISSRLIEFWCFGLPAALGVGGWGWGWLRVPPTHVHTHMHVVNMIISCKWLPPLGESLGIPYDVICMCVGGTLSAPPPTSTHPQTPGGPLESIKIQ